VVKYSVKNTGDTRLQSLARGRKLLGKALVECTIEINEQIPGILIHRGIIKAGSSRI
jgi:hypothetical protein